MENRAKVFRLMDLPFVVFRKVMYQLEFFAVLNLTSVSKKTKQNIRACALKAMDVELKLTSNFSNVLNVVYRGEKYSWGVIETVNADEQGTLLSAIDENVFKPICSQILYILHKKSVDTFRFDRPITSADISEHWDMLEGATDVYIGSEAVTRDEMNLVVNRFKALKNLFIDPNLPNGFDGLESQNLDVLYLEGDNDISLSSFSKLRASVLLMQSARLEKWELNLFIKNWISNEEAKQNRPSAIRVFNIETNLTILDGVKRHPWNPKLRSQFYVVELTNGVMAIDCADGFDIFRTDGVMATVLFQNNKFDFLVWTDRFQRVPENAVHC